MTTDEAKTYALIEAAQWLRSIARGDTYADDDMFSDTADQLSREERAVIRATLTEIAVEQLKRAGEQACGTCACTHDAPCELPDGSLCSWTADDLCNACAGLSAERPLIEVASR